MSAHQRLPNRDQIPEKYQSGVPSPIPFFDYREQHLPSVQAELEGNSEEWAKQSGRGAGIFSHLSIFKKRSNSSNNV